MKRPQIGTLQIKFADGREQIVPLEDGQTIRLGRSIDNDIVLDDPAVSRSHATISASLRGVVVADNSSLNGIFVNGARLEFMKDLDSNDIVDIGSTKLKVDLRSSQVIASLSTVSAARAMTASMEPVTATILVASIRNYKNISEQVPTVELMETLLRWTQTVSKVIQDGNGKLDKFVGHRVISFWKGHDEKKQAMQAVETAKVIVSLTDEISNSPQWKYRSIVVFFL